MKATTILAVAVLASILAVGFISKLRNTPSIKPIFYDPGNYGGSYFISKPSISKG